MIFASLSNSSSSFPRPVSTLSSTQKCVKNTENIVHPAPPDIREHFPAVVLTVCIGRKIVVVRGNFLSPVQADPLDHLIQVQIPEKGRACFLFIGAFCHVQYACKFHGPVTSRPLFYWNQPFSVHIENTTLVQLSCPCPFDDQRKLIRTFFHSTRSESIFLFSSSICSPVKIYSVLSHFIVSQNSKQFNHDLSQNSNRILLYYHTFPK